MPSTLQTLRRRFRRTWYALLARFDVYVLRHWWELRDLLSTDTALEERRQQRRRDGQPRCEMLELRWLMSNGVTDFIVPTSNAGVQAITAGPDNNLWFTEKTAGKIAKLTTSGTFTEYSLGAGHAPYDITAGPDGNLWFTDQVGTTGYVGRITTSGTVTEWSLPGTSSTPHGITLAVGIDGNLWLADISHNSIDKVTTGGSITSYTIPTSGSAPSDLVAGPDGNIWFTEQSGNKVANVTPTGTFTEYSMPQSSSLPTDILLGSDNNLWVSEQAGPGGRVARVLTDGTITEFTTPSTGPLTGATLGPDDNVWFLQPSTAKLDHVSPDGTIVEAVALATGSNPQDVTTGPDGLLWFTEPGTNKIGKLGWVTAASPALDPAGPGGTGGSRSAGGGGDLGGQIVTLPGHGSGGTSGTLPGGAASGASDGGVPFGPVELSPATGGYEVPIYYLPCKPGDS